MSDKSIKEEKGIINIRGYTFWHVAEVVTSHIYKFLKIKFPNSLILREFNRIDFVVLDKVEIPVEIQSTRTINNSESVIHSSFENSIRKQIEDNIENYDICWFFFDSEYYKYLNESATNRSSLNLDWFAKYVKEDTLKVFTVKYSGEIRELKYEDLEFIRKLSNTCKIEYENDERILNRNKLKIANNVLNGHNFTQDEINKFIDEFDKRDSKDLKLSHFLIKEGNKRRSLYGNVLLSIGNLSTVNKFLDMNNEYDDKAKSHCSYLGILKLYGSSDKTEFVDIFNICKYFPGYIRNIETWNSIKNGTFSNNQLRGVFYSCKDKQQKKLEF